jgi:hypothetical protein
MRHSVTTPGGFFIGLYGIAISVLVALVVYYLVKNPIGSQDLRTQQAGLGLAPAKDEQDPGKITSIEQSRDALLQHAADKYNGGKKPNLDDLEDLRGVVRLREAEKSVTTAEAALNAPSKETGKTVRELAIDEVVKEIQAKKPAASAVKADTILPSTGAPPSLPNLMGGGVHNVTFPSLEPAPAAPAPAPAAPANKPTASASSASAAPAPSRPPLLNGNEPTK